MWLVRGLVKCSGLLSMRFGDLANFIVTPGEIDAVKSPQGNITLRGYLEVLDPGDVEA